MKIRETNIKGAYHITLEPKEDERGYFMRTFCRNELSEAGVTFPVAQISRSLTRQKGAIRGLHFQHHPKTEDKIVQCLHGKIFDVAVDYRPQSPTYKKWISVELTEESRNMLLVPKGCAHGFQTLTEDCEVEYFMSAFNDPEFGIEWPLEVTQLSEKDKNWLLLEERDME